MFVLIYKLIPQNNLFNVGKRTVDNIIVANIFNVNFTVIILYGEFVIIINYRLLFLILMINIINDTLVR